MKSPEKLELRNLFGDKFFKQIWADFKSAIVNPKTGRLKKLPEISKIKYIQFFEAEDKIWAEPIDNESDIHNNLVGELKSEYCFNHNLIEDLDNHKLITLSNDLEAQIQEVTQIYQNVEVDILLNLKSLFESIAEYSNYYTKTTEEPSEGEKFMGSLILSILYHRFERCDGADKIKAFFENEYSKLLTENFINEENLDKWIKKYSEKYLDTLYEIQEEKLEIVEEYIHLKAKFYQLRKLISKKLNTINPRLQEHLGKKEKVIEYIENSKIPSKKKPTAKKFMLFLSEHDQLVSTTIKDLWEEAGLDELNYKNATNYYKTFLKL